MRDMCLANFNLKKMTSVTLNKIIVTKETESQNVKVILQKWNTKFKTAIPVFFFKVL